MAKTTIDASEQRHLVIDVESAAVLHGITTLDVDAARLVFRARSTSDGVVVAGSTEALEDLVEHVAAEANHETQRRRQRLLDATLDLLENALPEQ